MNGWWERYQSWRASCVLTLHPPLVSASLPLSAAACILLRGAGSPGKAPSRPLAPTPVSKRAASWGVLCLHPHCRVPRTSSSDSNQHRRTAAWFISRVAAIRSRQCKKKQPVLPMPRLLFAIPLVMCASLIYIAGRSFLGAGITFPNTVSLPAWSFFWGCPTGGAQPCLKIGVAVPSLMRTKLLSLNSGVLGWISATELSKVIVCFPAACGELR